MCDHTHGMPRFCVRCCGVFRRGQGGTRCLLCAKELRAGAGNAELQPCTGLADCTNIEESSYWMGHSNLHRVLSWTRKIGRVYDGNS